MEKDQKQALLQQLIDLQEHRPLRLILTVKVAPEEEGNLPTPDQFVSRSEYRQALIRRRVGFGAKKIEDAAERFRKSGLISTTGILTKTIIVEGEPNLLAAAVQDEAIESAVIDHEISLIRPVAEGDLDEN